MDSDVLDLVSMQVTYFSGLAGPTVGHHPYLVSFLVLWAVSTVAVVGPFVYGRYYLYKYHSLRQPIEKV